MMRRSEGEFQVSRYSVCAGIQNAALLLALLALGELSAQLPPDATWEANAVLEKSATCTVEGLGAMQGVSFRDDKIYLYGDV